MSYLSTLVDFQNLGCKNETKIGLACRVYMNLLQKKNINILEKIYHNDLDLIYLRGKRSKTDIVIIPILHTDSVDMTSISKLQIENDNETSIILAICDTSSNILYYKMAGGIKMRSLDTKTNF